MSSLSEPARRSFRATAQTSAQLGVKLRCPIHRQSLKNDLIDPLQRPASGGCIVNLRLGYLPSTGHPAGVSANSQLPLPVDHLTKASRGEDRYWDSSSSSRIESPFPRKMQRRAPAGLNPKSKAVGTVFRRLTAASQSARQS